MTIGYIKLSHIKKLKKQFIWMRAIKKDMWGKIFIN